eukprot:gene55097-61322_t
MSRIYRCFHLLPPSLWALSNALSLGSASARVVVAGDSAGGNLAMAVALAAAQRGDRVPDAVLVAYPALRIRMAIGPSRLLSVFDPLLPLGILRRCLEAYAGDDEPPQGGQANSVARGPKMQTIPPSSQDPLLSPNEAPAELLLRLPRIRLLASEFDPLLDDSVEMGHRLRDAGHPDWRLEVAKGIPHGFLSLAHPEGQLPAMPGQPAPCRDATDRFLDG